VPRNCRQAHLVAGKASEPQNGRNLDSFTIIPTSASTAESDPIILRETSTTRLVFKPLLVKNPHDEKASVKGCFVFQHKPTNDDWKDHDSVSLARLRGDEWIKLDLTSEELLGLLQNLGAFYRANAKYGLPREKSRFIKVSSADKLDFDRLFQMSRRTGIDAVAQLLEWLTESGNAVEVLENLKRLKINTLQRLNGLIGLTTLKAALADWEENKSNSSEEFWQNLFHEHAFILSQVFCLPTFILKEKAYVGGKSVNNRGGHLVDFLIANRITKNCALIEIKTPVTKLLGREYRAGVYSLSEELSGSITQVLNYRLSLLTHYNSLSVDTNSAFEIFAPPCFVIAGNANDEFSSDEQTQSLELIRSDLKNVSIVTFDELFAKTQALIDALEGASDG
jgi:hypothetical protein